MTWKDDVKEFVRAKMTKRQKKLLAWVQWDLHEGSVGGDEYPGFTSACDELGDMEIPEVYYSDDTGEVTDIYPEDPEGWTQIGTRTIKVLVFGVAAEYI